MIDFTAIIEAAKAMGATVEDVEENANPLSENMLIPKRFRTKAMAQVLRGQGLQELAGSWTNPPCVTCSHAGVTLPRITSSTATHATKPVGQNPGLSGQSHKTKTTIIIELAWDFGEILTLIGKEVATHVVPGITLHCHLQDGTSTKMHLAPLDISGTCALVFALDIIMLRPVLTLGINNRAMEFLFADRLFP